MELFKSPALMEEGDSRFALCVINNVGEITFQQSELEDLAPSMERVIGQ